MTFASRMLRVVEVVIDHHLDPPTRQEMILGGTKQVFKVTKKSISPPDLSRRVSSMSSEEEFRTFLQEIWHGEVAADSDSEEQLEETMMRGMLEVSQSRFISTEDRRVRQQLAENRYVGIGITFRITEESGLPEIIEATPYGPADTAGVQAKDEILEVDDVFTKGLAPKAVVRMLRGPEGSSLKLLVRRSPSREEAVLQMIRGKVPIRTVFGFQETSKADWDYQPDSAIPVGYVRIDDIGGSSVHDRAVERQLQGRGIQALVLDLRQGGRGRVHSTVLLADSLLDGGSIGSVRSNERTQYYNANNECLFGGWPLAVLINDRTGEEFEWLAAALQDNRRGVLIGEPTGGRWLVQTPVPLSEAEAEGAIMLATGRMVRSNETKAQREGRKARNWVTPDHRVEFDWKRWARSMEKEGNQKKGQDPQLAFAIEHLTGALRQEKD